MVTIKSKPSQENVKDKFNSNGCYKRTLEDGNEDYIKKELLLTSEQLIEKLKICIELSPLDKDDFLKNLSEESGRSLTLLKEQLNYFKNQKRLIEKNDNKNYPVENLTEKLGNMFDKKELAEHIIEVQPCLYDNSRSWWLWNWPETKWERVDETDILNAVDRQATINTINSKEKNEMIEALKQVSRLNVPEPIGIHTVQFKNTIMNIKTGEQSRATPHLFVTNPIPWKLNEDGKLVAVNAELVSTSVACSIGVISVPNPLILNGVVSSRV